MLPRTDLVYTCMSQHPALADRLTARRLGPTVLFNHGVAKRNNLEATRAVSQSRRSLTRPDVVLAEVSALLRVPCCGPARQRKFTPHAAARDHAARSPTWEGATAVGDVPKGPRTRRHNPVSIRAAYRGGFTFHQRTCNCRACAWVEIPLCRSRLAITRGLVNPSRATGL